MQPSTREWDPEHSFRKCQQIPNVISLSSPSPHFIHLAYSFFFFLMKANRILFKRNTCCERKSIWGPIQWENVLQGWTSWHIAFQWVPSHMTVMEFCESSGQPGYVSECHVVGVVRYLSWELNWYWVLRTPRQLPTSNQTASFVQHILSEKKLRSYSKFSW